MIRVERYFYTNEKYKELKAKETFAFETEVRKTPYFTFSFSKPNLPDSTLPKSLYKKILEFKHHYIAMTSGLIIRLDSVVDDKFVIDAKNTEHEPMFNYADWYLDFLLSIGERHNSPVKFSNILKFSFSLSGHFKERHEQLIELHYNSIKLFNKGKKGGVLSDLNFINYSNSENQNLLFLRDVLVKYKVPIQIKDRKVIREILFHKYDFINAIQKELIELNQEKKRYKSFYGDHNLIECKRILNVLKENHLPKQQLNHIKNKQNQYIKSFPIQVNSVVLLKTNKVLLVDKVLLPTNKEIIIECSLLKTNCERSKINSVVSINEVVKFITSDQFEEFKNKDFKSHKLILKQWINTKGKRLSLPKPKIEFTVQAFD